MLFSLFQYLQDLFFFVAYVNVNSSFPDPLSAKKEEEYLKLMEQNDPDAREKLIEHNLRLVAHIAKKFTNGGRDIDDLISIGTIGLIKAVSTFRSQKGSTLATYAARCIEKAILSYRNLGRLHVFYP